MADRKISDLTALTTPASGDYLPIVDISEAAAASKNKRITIEDLMRGVPDGTAAAPGIAFETDPNTGIYPPGADQLAVATNGNERLRITAAGLVGIGLTQPDSRLVVKSSASSATIFRCNSANNINIFQVYENSTGDAEVYIKNTAGAPKIALLANGSSYIIGGSLGLGTTTPSSLLHLGDAGNITVGTTTGTKIGTATTQKLGFYNATPVVQPIAVADATDAATAITQLNALLARMRDLGLIAT
jgi:hypothetical protein